MRIRFATIVVLVTLFALSCTTSPRMNKDEMFADMDPIELRTVSIGVSKILAQGSKGIEAIAVLYPREGVVSLEFAFSGNKNQVFFDAKSRSAFISAFGEYQKLYEAHALNREQKANKPVLGAVVVTHRWGVLTMNGEAYPKASLSYTFEDKSPYFAIFIPRTPNAVYQGKTGSRVKESFDVTLYFTRAQATALAELFDQDFLVKVVEEKKQETLYGDGDEYVEKGAADEAYKEAGSTADPDYVEAE